jgi:hypothetical protein
MRINFKGFFHLVHFKSILNCRFPFYIRQFLKSKRNSSNNPGKIQLPTPKKASAYTSARTCRDRDIANHILLYFMFSSQELDFIEISNVLANGLLIN